jgi:rod shape-determining protein MreC
MFSKKIVIIVGVIVLIAINIIAISISNRRYHSFGAGRIAISFIAPFQSATTHSISFIKGIWNRYFFLISLQEENDNLRKVLSSAIEKNNQNKRLRNILNFRKTIAKKVIVAEVIGKDPSPWFKTIIIDKGKADGVVKSLPVVVPEGIVGQVTDVSSHYSKVLLIIDRISAVDALIQRTRARGIVVGESEGRCIFNYILRKHDIKVGDSVIS